MEAFTFSPPEPLNCNVIDSSGQLIYAVHPPKNIIGISSLSSLVISKIPGSDTPEPIATISHHKLLKDKFKFLNEELKGLEWQDNHRTFQFIAPWDSKTYAWSISDDGKEFKLRENSNRSEDVAIFQQGKHSELTDSLKPTLFITPEEKIFDGVIATFIYFTKMLRERAKEDPDHLGKKIGETAVQTIALAGAGV